MKLTKEERQKRVIARGEVSGHSHIIIGEATIENGFISVTGPAWIKHLLEKEYVEEGKEVWTKEHEDIQIKPGKYEYIQQVEFDPYEGIIREVYD